MQNLLVLPGIPTKRSHFEKNCSSPSDCGKNSSRLALVRDHRFSSGLHTSLQVKAFGHFLDIMDKPDHEIESKYHEVAGSLMNEMRKFYPNEIMRQDAFATALLPILPPFRPISKGRAKSDYTTSVTLNGISYAIINWDFKNEMCGISSEPNKQGHGYYVHIQAGSKDRSPMLLASIVGCHYFQVFGAVWNGNHICVDPLCEPVSLLPVPRDPKYGAEKLAHVLAAICSTADELEKYYSEPDKEYRGPYYRSCPLGALTNMKRMNAEWLFTAECNGNEVVVKFVRTSYGKVVHEFLARHELAPKLFSVTPLQGGWQAVVMEKTNGATIPLTVTKPIKESLKKAVCLMHEKGYVHGDLRPQNILVVDDNTVRIVDFDWAGEYPNARYSRQLNMQCEWHSGVGCGGIITKDHDLYQFHRFTEY